MPLHPKIHKLKYQSPVLQNATLFEDKIFNEVTKLSSMGGGPNSIGPVSLLEEEEIPGGSAQRNNVKVVICKARGETSRETTPAEALIFNFQPQNW